MARIGKGTCPDADDLVGYALGALDPAEERRVAAHVAGCERCARELGELAPAVGVLAESVEQLEPPAGLRQSLMATVHSDAAAGAAAEDATAAPAPRRDRVMGFLWRPAAALGATALVAAGAVGYLVHDNNGGAAASEFAVKSPLPGAGGTLEVENGMATLHAHGMPQLARGAVYQVWVADGGAPVPSATFVPHSDGTATAAVPEAAHDAGAVMVTREPRPGMRTPTPPPVLRAQL